MSEKILTLMMTTISLLATIFMAYTAWGFNRVSIRKGTRQDHASMAREIDILLINNPELFSIYDSHETSKIKSMSAHEVAKREAFILLMINTFEVIHDYYTGVIIKNRHDTNHWNAWQTTIREFFCDSTESRILFMKYKDQYSLKFSKYIVNIINDFPHFVDRGNEVAAASSKN